MTANNNVAHIKMGLKLMNGNQHSKDAGIFPSAPWHLVWALGTMKNENGEVLVDGLCDNGKKSLNFTEMKIGYTGEGDMTIIPAEAYCTMDVALADGQTPEEACALIRKHLDSHGAADVGVALVS